MGLVSGLSPQGGGGGTEPAESPPDPLIGTPIGSYVVERRLGGGAMGEV